MSDEKEPDGVFEISLPSGTLADLGGDSTLPPPPDLSPEQERSLWWKIDLRLLPILSLTYLMSFLDRGMVTLRPSIVLT